MHCRISIVHPKKMESLARRNCKILHTWSLPDLVWRQETEEATPWWRSLSFAADYQSSKTQKLKLSRKRRGTCLMRNEAQQHDTWHLRSRKKGTVFLATGTWQLLTCMEVMIKNDACSSVLRGVMSWWEWLLLENDPTMRKHRSSGRGFHWGQMRGSKSFWSFFVWVEILWARRGYLCRLM